MRIIIITILIMLSQVALAEEPARYNFATTTAASNIMIQPGETLRVPAVYFFNIFGNRITHVSLYITNVPKGWDVKIEPEMHEVQVNISGTVVTERENLYVMPSQAVDEVPAVVPEGMAYITLGGVKGNIPAKVAYLNITVPASVPLGGSYPISIRATGSWFGQAATLAFSQERNFDFTVHTVASKYTEEIVQNVNKPDDNSPAYATYLIPALIILIAIGFGFYAGKKKK